MRKTVLFVVVLVCFLSARAFSADPAEGQAVDPDDVAVINDLDIMEHWDDLQNSEVFDDHGKQDAPTTGVDYGS